MAETPGLIGVEAVIREQALLPGGGIFGQPDGPTLELQTYELLVLGDGAVRCHVLGLISPRPDEVDATLAQSIEQISRGEQIRHDAMMRANELARKSARLIGDPRWYR